MHIQYWITYDTYYVVVLWAIHACPHFAKSELNCFPRGINPKVKRQHLILIFMLCFQIFWHPVMNSLSHWFEIFFNLWLTPSWCNKKTRWNGLLKSILAMLPKGEITFEKVDSSFQLWFSGLFEIQNQHVVSSLSFSHFLFMIKLSQLTT